ncbi:MAG TPA: hypothetical protein VFE50_04210 [Cyclobacteriaceae bacterium]|nr:hypothetical protein [Cyclobacteriaceae bacterium]
MAIKGSNKCCTEEHDILQIDDDQAASTVVSIAPNYFEIGNLFEPIPLNDNTVAHVNVSAEESPPPLSDVPLFTKHCSLVFYDDEMIA